MPQLAVVFIFSLLSYVGVYYYTENFMGIVIISLMIFVSLWEGINFPLAALVSYILIHTCYFLFWHPSPFIQYGVGYEHYFKAVMGSGIFYLIMFLLGTFLLPVKYFKSIYKLLHAICLGSSVVVLTSYLLTGKARGIIGATSIDGALIATTFPFLFRKIYQDMGVPFAALASAFILTSIILLGGSVSIGCFTVAFCACF